MPSKKDEDMFSLAALPSSQNWLQTREMVPTDDIPLTVAEKRSAVEYRRQIQAIHQERMKALIAEGATKDIIKSQYQTMSDLVDETWEIRSRPREAIPQMYVDKYWERCMVRGGVHLEEIAEDGIEAISGIVSRSTYVSRVPSSRGIRAKLRGDDNGY